MDVNGEFLAKDLITLKFIFNLHLHSIEQTLDTFRTSFWLKEKRWFVAYRRRYLYTIPCSLYQSVDQFFQPPKYGTILKNAILYNHITTLEIESNNVTIEFLPTIVNLSGIKNLTLPSSLNQSEIKYLLNAIPGLQNLSIDTLMSDTMYEDFRDSGKTFWDFLEKSKDLQFEHIRALTISEHHIIGGSYMIDRLCRLFPHIERLHVAIGRLDATRQFIFSDICPIFQQKYDRRFVYLFGFVFVWIYI